MKLNSKMGCPRKMARNTVLALVDKIRIPADLEMMLQAKVQISEKLRRDFYDILEKGRGADSFNKE